MAGRTEPIGRIWPLAARPGPVRRDQDALTGRTHKVGRRTLTLDPGDVPPGDAVELAAAADRQLELADRMDRLLDSLGSLSDEMRDEARRGHWRADAPHSGGNPAEPARPGLRRAEADRRGPAGVSELLSGRAEETADSHSPGSTRSANAPHTAASHPPRSPEAGRDAQAGRQGRAGRHAGVPGGQSTTSGAKEDIRSLLSRFWGQLPPHQRGQSPAMGRRGFSRRNTRP